MFFKESKIRANIFIIIIAHITNSGVDIALVGMPITLTLHAISSIRARFNSVIPWCTIFARITLIIWRTLTVFNATCQNSVSSHRQCSYVHRYERKPKIKPREHTLHLQKVIFKKIISQRKPTWQRHLDSNTKL